MKLPRLKKKIRKTSSGFTLIRTSLRENLVNVNRFALIRTRLSQNIVNLKGFTLIELLVVIITMGLLFGFGYANYRSFQRRQQLESVVREFKTNLRLAQQLALTGKKEVECGTLEGYRVRRAGAQSYEIGAICDATETCGNTPSYCIKTVNLPSNLTLGPFSSPGNYFTFLVLTQGVDRPDTTVVTFTQTGTGYTKSVNITPSGEIY